MIEIRYVKESDKLFWNRLDHHLPEAEFINKVKSKTGYVLFKDQVPAGILRYSLFWDNTPFCNLIFVEEQMQKKGLGRMLMEHWESDMRTKGYGMLLTSTRADEASQHFYRRLGYRDCGSLIIDIPRYAQPAELFFIKEISG